MMWLVLYFIISIIIARYLDKKMRVATVFHSIMFIIITCYLLLLSNTSFIVNAFEHLLGKDTYNIFKEALYEYNTYFSAEISAFAVIESILLTLTVVVLSVTAVKVVNKTIELFKHGFLVLKGYIRNNGLNLAESLQSKKIYLVFCRLLN